MSFRLASKSVTLNDLERVMALILRYFTEFVYDYLGRQTAITRLDGRRCIDD